MSGAFRLALDCSTEYLAVALIDEQDRVTAAESTAVGRQHAARLPTALQALLADAEVERSALVGLRVGVGPGSYTGIRVALATAKGLARALGIELAGVSSFVGLAAAVLEPGSEALVTLDARRGNVYAQVCRRESDWASGAAARVTTLSEAVKLPVSEVAARFPGLALVPAQGFDAAALAGSGQLIAPKAVYL